MSEETKFPSPFKNIAKALDSIQGGNIQVAYLDEKDKRYSRCIGGKVKGLRSFLGVDANASLADCFLILSNGQKGVLIEDKDGSGERAYETARRQLDNTFQLLVDKNERIDYVIMANIKLDGRTRTAEQNDTFPLPQVKFLISQKFEKVKYKGKEAPIYLYR